MWATDIILKKRNQGEIPLQEIDFLIQKYVDGMIPDYQTSALLKTDLRLNKKIKRSTVNKMV